MNTKAVRIHGKMDLRLDEITLPEVGPDDVQVKIISDSVCMSTYKAAIEGEDQLLDNQGTIGRLTEI